MALNYTKGTLSFKSEITSGTSQSGNKWARMSILVDVPGYQGSITKVMFQVSMDRIDDVQAFSIGDKVEIGWNIYAREWQGKWFNNVELVNIKAQESPLDTPAKETAKEQKSPFDPAAHTDDLPL